MDLHKFWMKRIKYNTTSVHYEIFTKTFLCNFMPPLSNKIKQTLRRMTSLYIWWILRKKMKISIHATSMCGYFCNLPFSKVLKTLILLCRWGACEANEWTQSDSWQECILKETSVVKIFIIDCICLMLFHIKEQA